jgi:hypothetical protein
MLCPFDTYDIKIYLRKGVAGVGTTRESPVRYGK